MTGHEGTEWGEHVYNTNISLTLVLYVKGWSTPRPGRFIPTKDPVPAVEEAGWASGPVWICAENLASTEIRSPDRQASSVWLYRLNFSHISYL